MNPNPALPPAGPTIAIWCSALALSLPALSLLAVSLPAQARVDHHLTFAIGDPAAQLRTTIIGARQATLAVGWPSWQPGAHRITMLDRRHRARRLWAATGEALPIAPGEPGTAPRWLAKPSGATCSFTTAVALTGREIEDGLGQRDLHRYTSDGKPATIRYFEGYALLGATTWPLVVGHLGAVQRVTFALAPGFTLCATKAPAADGTYTFPDYAALAACSFHIAARPELSELLEFRAAGRRYRVGLCAFQRDRTDRDALRAALSAIADSQSRALGPATTTEYTFLFGRTSDPRTIGQETGCELLTANLHPAAAQLLNLSRAHLQSWFGRLAPAADPSHPPASGTEWFVEGVLEYLAELSLVRGGLLRAGTYWQTGIEAHINTLQRDSSRLQVSVVDAGARRYQEPPQGQPRRPAGPDPTVKGLLLGLLLDVEIRTRSAGRRSLDGAVQGLLGRRAPVSNASIQAACEAVAGGKLDGFFNRFVTGTEELPLTATLARVGLVAAPVSTGEGDAPVNPRMPKPRPRPPRWRVTLDPQATEQTQQLRAAMTEVVVK